MKLLSTILVASAVFSLASCETTREINLKADGSGQLNTTIDLSSVIAMAKGAGAGKELEASEQKKMDTTFSLEKIADSLGGLSSEEKALLRKGTMDFKMDLADDKFVAATHFNFTDPSQIAKLNALTGKIIQDAMKKKMAGDGGESGTPPGMPDADMMGGSTEDYYTTSFTKTGIEKKLIADKYAKVGEDKSMESIKEMGGQVPMNTTVIYNLPRPAKKVTGKNAVLSDDKKKVTITESMEDFFDDGKNLEFKIEY